MTHGDDDGLRLPPAIAPRQVVIVPMLRDKPEDAEVLAYCEALADGAGDDVTLSAQPMRALLDKKPIKSADKRWNWVRRGAPIIVEIGPRDAAAGQVTFMRRDRLRDGDKVASQGLPRDDFIAAGARLAGRNPGQPLRRGQGAARRQYPHAISRISTAIAAYFGAAAEDDDAKSGFKGWVRAPWARPTGAELEAVEARLKALKLTLRNVPVGQEGRRAPASSPGGRRSRRS